jgi:hypothetical protein
MFDSRAISSSAQRRSGSSGVMTIGRHTRVPATETSGTGSPSHSFLAQNVLDLLFMHFMPTPSIDRAYRVCAPARASSGNFRVFMQRKAFVRA